MTDNAKYSDKSLIDLDQDAAQQGAPGRMLSDPQSDIGHKVRTAKVRKLTTTLNLSSNTCRWPIGDPAKAGFHYCGEPPRPGRVYCSTHDTMSYQVASRRK